MGCFENGGIEGKLGVIGNIYDTIRR